jgi:hypothetical protein
MTGEPAGQPNLDNLALSCSKSAQDQRRPGIQLGYFGLYRSREIPKLGTNKSLRDSIMKKYLDYS